MQRMIIPPHMRNVVPHISEEDRIEAMKQEVVEALLNGEEFRTHISVHSQADVMQHLHDNTDDADELEKSLFALQTADKDQYEFLIAGIKKLIRRAATEYVDTLTAEIVESDKRDQDEEMADYLADQFHDDADYHL